MAQCSITLDVKVAWWVRPYIQTVAIFAALTGLQPDAKKVARTVTRGVRVTCCKTCAAS
jgi:hypothetical protein